MGMSNEAEISKILGIDYGESKVGLAKADSETRIAFVYGTLENGKDFLQKLLEIIEREEIDKIIIGVPPYINKKVRSLDKLLF
jgi:RNase H-fold protein (predicted Holliday junction resolvase)